MKHKRIQWGFPPAEIRASWHPIRSIGEFFTDLLPWEREVAKDLAKNAGGMSRQDIIMDVAGLKQRAENNVKVKEETNGEDSVVR